jgi:hypothetical protein
MNVAIIANAADSLVHDLPRRRVDWRLGLFMGAAAVAGGQAGTFWLGRLGKPELVDLMIRAGFLVLLAYMAYHLLRKKLSRGDTARRWLFHMPLRYQSPWEEAPVSALGPVLASLGGGLVASLLGVGGGIFYVPVLLALFHRPLQELVPVSQIAVLLGTLSVSTGHVLHTGFIDPRLSLILITAGSVGTVVGTRLKSHLESRLLERLLALVLLAAALRLALPLIGLEASPARAATTLGRDWLRPFADWCARDPLHLWLGTVGVALGMAPLLSWLQHALLDRLRRGAPPDDHQQPTGTTPGQPPGNTRATPGQPPGDTRATPGRHQGDTRATPGRHQGNPRATPGQHQGDTRATPGQHQGNTRATPGRHQGANSPQ